MHLPGWRRGRPGVGLDKPYYDVHGAPAHGELRCYLLSDAPFYGECHYDKEARRHYPCPGKPHCDYCRAGKGKRRKGYIAAMFASSRQLFVLELTDKSLDDFEKLTAGRQSCRGLLVSVKRTPKADGSANRLGKVRLSVESTEGHRHLPPAFDELPHLLKMWGHKNEAEYAAEMFDGIGGQIESKE